METTDGKQTCGGIANFGWVTPGRVARGEQPRPESGGYRFLAQTGITCLISLREAWERRNLVAGRPFEDYRFDDEAAECAEHDLDLIHVPFQDRTIPAAAGLVTALEALDEQVALGRTVYIHCMAGIGRTGLVAALWRLAQGGDGDDAADEFICYWIEFGEREDTILGPMPEPILERYGFRLQWWALLCLAEMVGSPVRRDHEGVKEEVPEDAEEWLAEAARTVVPWVNGRRENRFRTTR